MLMLQGAESRTCYDDMESYGHWNAGTLQQPWDYRDTHTQYTCTHSTQTHTEYTQCLLERIIERKSLETNDSFL